MMLFTLMITDRIYEYSVKQIEVFVVKKKPFEHWKDTFIYCTRWDKIKELLKLFSFDNLDSTPTLRFKKSAWQKIDTFRVFLSVLAL